MILQALELCAAALWSVLLWWFFVLPVWPWDWRGRRKDIKLQSRRRDWDDPE